MENKKLETQIQSLQQELDSMKKNQNNRARKLNQFFKTSLAMSLFAGSFYVFAQVAGLHIFQNGEVISAQKINENFALLQSQITNSAGVTVVAVASEDIPTHAIINLSDAENGKTYVVHKTARFNLPSTVGLTPGYTFKVNLGKESQISIYPEPNEIFEGNPGDITIVGVMSNYNNGFNEIQFSSAGWVFLNSNHTLSTIIDPATVYTGTCTGQGAADANCFTNTSAKAVGKAIGNNYYYSFDNTNITWQRIGIYDFLINDPLSHLQPADYHTKSLTLAKTQVQFSGGGDVYAEKNEYHMMSAYINEHRIHSNPTNQNYMNDIIDNNPAEFFDVVSNSMTGASCQSQYGKSWRHITDIQASSVGNLSFAYWTATTGSGDNSFIYMIAGSGGSAEQVGDTMNSAGTVCIYTP